MAQASGEQIQKWKDQYGEIFEIKVEDKFAYFKKPDRKIVAQASALQAVPVRSNEALLKGCFIGGDAEIKDDDKYFLAAQGMLAPLMETADAEIKKL